MYLTGKGKGKGKGKGLPITGHEGPEGEQMYSSALPSTSALDGGGCSSLIKKKMCNLKITVLFTLSFNFLVCILSKTNETSIRV